MAADGRHEGEALRTTKGRELYTEEINAAVRGAKAAGANEIVVMDCHGAGEEWTFNSLIPDKLDPDCEFVVQNDWTEYTELLEQGCDAALFVGHAREGGHAGRRARAHRVRTVVARAEVQRQVGRRDRHQRGALRTVELSGAARHRRRGRLPRGRELLGDGLTTVAVKKGLGQFSARQFPALKARELIEEGAKKALKDLRAVKP